ncbi:carbohydrate kinase family protein [Streptomyces sp. BH106]|uniref:carbohydrate kinase family protein n=1 Tax=Streptomyces sp. BH106 TaxID=3410409 RepID=UPI003CFAF690
MAQTHDPARIAVVGESLIDLVGGSDGRTYTAHPGGSPMNVAYGLGQLARPVTLLTRLGEDPFGHILRDHLAAAGVELGLRPDDSFPTSMALVALDAQGAATYDFRIEWSLPTAAPLPDDAVAVHTGSIAAALEPGATAVEELLSGVRERGTATVTYDPNCRPALMGSRSAALARVERLVALSDVVKVSDEDLAWLYGDRKVEEVAEDWLGRGPALVVVTRGARGAYAVGHAAVVERPALAVDVVDTVGAGDAFMSGLLDSLAREDLLGADRRAALASLPAGPLARIVDRAAHSAALTVGRAGALPPTAAELDA